MKSPKKKAAEKSAPAIRIAPAKGRPMLGWVGKRALRQVTSFPAQLIERFSPDSCAGPTDNRLWSDWPTKYARGGLLFHGDNKEVLGHLLAGGFRGKVKLIYIDPPFDSGADYVRRVSLRGPSGAAKVGGENYTLGEQIQYTDIWSNDNYLQFMYERLMLLKELLADDGSVYVHMDSGRGHQIKLICDEVFGADSFQREIVWRIGWVSGYKSAARNWIRNHDTIFFYTKDPKRFVFNKEYIPYPKGYLRRGGTEPEGEGYPIEDTWNASELDRLDSIQIMSFSREKMDYPTQKNENLLARIIRASSDQGDLVLDCFVGSGTTISVAQQLGRRWIGCDINKGSVQTAARRVQQTIERQIGGTDQQPELPASAATAAAPAQLSYSSYRVNDYDLALQHNEAVNLACEHIGIERSRGDAYFDGTLGKSLVKIIPFGRPLTPLDLTELRRELDSRPDEDRAITLVCLGMESAAKAEIVNWNTPIRGRSGVNRIEVIELRTDPKYGGFIAHQPAEAKVSIQRQKDAVHVVIEKFISPSIVQRLRDQAGILEPRIEDWRAMIDCVLIDTAYDGKVLNVSRRDAPEKKTDLIVGRYELTAPNRTTIAVKIVDMLGEEVLIARTV